MREVRVTVEPSMAASVAKIAHDVGIEQATVYQVYVHGPDARRALAALDLKHGDSGQRRGRYECWRWHDENRRRYYAYEYLRNPDAGSARQHRRFQRHRRADDSDGYRFRVAPIQLPDRHGPWPHRVREGWPRQRDAWQ